MTPIEYCANCNNEIKPRVIGSPIWVHTSSRLRLCRNRPGHPDDWTDVATPMDRFHIGDTCQILNGATKDEIVTITGVAHRRTGAGLTYFKYDVEFVRSGRFGTDYLHQDLVKLWDAKTGDAAADTDIPDRWYNPPVLQIRAPIGTSVQVSASPTVPEMYHGGLGVIIKRSDSDPELVTVAFPPGQVTTDAISCWFNDAELIVLA